MANKNTKKQRRLSVKEPLSGTKIEGPRFHIVDEYGVQVYGGSDGVDKPQAERMAKGLRINARIEPIDG